MQHWSRHNQVEYFLCCVLGTRLSNDYLISEVLKTRFKGRKVSAVLSPFLRFLPTGRSNREKVERRGKWQKLHFPRIIPKSFISDRRFFNRARKNMKL